MCRQLSRREFLHAAGLLASAAALGACTSQALDDQLEAEATSTATVAPVQAAPTAAEVAPSLTITIVYNNIAHDARLDVPWGFAALIEYGGQQVLFDTGADSPTLLGNMDILGKDPSVIQKVVLSHIHDDHVGGLHGLLETGVRPTVYVPPSFPHSFRSSVAEITDLVEVAPGQEIAEGMFSTGEMSTDYASLLEQSLVVESRGGLVVITGCAHPGIVEIVRQARELSDEPVFLAMGGFHLRDASDADLAEILADLRQLEVGRVSPSHCTGSRAINVFAEEYGDGFVRSGAGTVITI